jgi:hypothetical protein
MLVSITTKPHLPECPASHAREDQPNKEYYVVGKLYSYFYLLYPSQRNPTYLNAPHPTPEKISLIMKDVASEPPGAGWCKV